MGGILNNKDLSDREFNKQNVESLNSNIKRAADKYSFAESGFGQQSINGTIADSASILNIGGVALIGNAYPVTYNNGTTMTNKFVLVNTAPPAYLLQTIGDNLIITFDNKENPKDQIIITDFQDGDFGISPLSDDTSFKAGKEFIVNSFTTNNPKKASITSLLGGGFVIVWYGTDYIGSSLDAFAQVFDAKGKPIGEEFSISPFIGTNQYFPSVASLSNGGFVIAFQSGEEASSDGIFMRTYDANGNLSGSELQVNTFVFSDQTKPSVSSLKDGGFVVVWQSATQDGGGFGTFIQSFGIYAQRYDASGNPSGSEFQVNTYVSGGQINASVHSLENGGFIVVWQSFGQDSSEYGIYAQIYDASGNPSGSEFQVNTSVTLDQINPVVTSLKGGDFIIVWQSANQDGSDFGIIAQRFKVDGTPVGGEVIVNTHTDGAQTTPSITALADGGYVIAWHSHSQDGSGPGVYAQRYNADGSMNGEETPLNEYIFSDHRFPAITSLGNGFVAAWESKGQDGSSTGVYARIFNPGYEAGQLHEI